MAGNGFLGIVVILLIDAPRVSQCAHSVELLAALRPTMATVDGSLIGLSTPFGKRGWFYESWSGGDPSWTRIRVPASDCPRISQAFLVDERRELGALRFSEEYELAWNEPESSMFPTAIIERAFTSDVTPLWR
jgi:hypothetical protein